MKTLRELAERFGLQIKSGADEPAATSRHQRWSYCDGSGRRHFVRDGEFITAACPGCPNCREEPDHRRSKTR